jgi:putative redox protein
MNTEPQSDGNSAPPAATNTAQLPATVTVTWDGDQRFDAGRPDRDTIRLDGSGATGPSPVDALLGSLAACAGIDVAEILAKRRTPASSLTIQVIGERVTTIPKRLKHVTLHFQIAGAGIDRENAERAIDLSINKYCSVRDSLRPDVPIEWTLELVTSGW